MKLNKLAIFLFGALFLSFTSCSESEDDSINQVIIEAQPKYLEGKWYGNYSSNDFTLTFTLKGELIVERRWFNASNKPEYTRMIYREWLVIKDDEYDKYGLKLLAKNGYDDIIRITTTLGTPVPDTFFNFNKISDTRIDFDYFKNSNFAKLEKQ